MNNLWNTIQGWFTQNGQHYTCVSLPDSASTIESLVPYQHYFRLWLSDMFLSKSRNWFVDTFPSVNAQVKLSFAGASGVTFSQMAAPPKELTGPGVFQNYPLTPLLPYPGGVVEIVAGLLALEGKSGWVTAVKVLEKFSGLVAPPLGQSLALAQQVTGAVSDFMSDSKGGVHLGFHQAYSAVGGGGANTLKSGYIGVALTPKGGLAARQQRVEGDKWLVDGKPLTDCDYMLFRVEARTERDDWQMPNIVEPWDKARTAFATNKAAEGKELRASAIAAAFLAPDLTRPDQLRVAKAIKADLTEVEALGQGAAAVAAPSLQVIVGQGLSWEQARTEPRPSLAELLAE